MFLALDTGAGASGLEALLSGLYRLKADAPGAGQGNSRDPTSKAD